MTSPRLFSLSLSWPRPRRYLQSMLAGTLLAVSLPSPAHEFWLQADPFASPAGRETEISLFVGEFFVGELVGVTTGHAASIRLVSAKGTQDLTSRAPAASMLRSLPLPVGAPGAHVLAYDSHPSQVVLSADKFHAYLNEEGLGAVIRQREIARTAATDGRERFRRYAKALLKVGGRSDATSLAAVGQKLEIVPLTDPLAGRAGDPLRFEVRLDGRPLSSVLVKAWHRRGGQTTAIRATADSLGRVQFELPFAGVWMLNTVHMVPVAGIPDLDWDSFWSSLTFELSGREAGRAAR